MSLHHCLLLAGDPLLLSLDATEDANLLPTVLMTAGRRHGLKQIEVCYTK